ncbi:MAG: hypothetical protein PWQ12_1155 [Clostridiales bacterium]|jgi:tetratricopeptide (TPR) repeat protein|nr:hypothetical protein [Clostridiales bacterium]
MATHFDFHYRLLARFLKEVLFIEIKPEREMNFGGMKWPNEIPLPVYVPELADKIKDNDIEQIPMIALLKGLVYYLGADSENQYKEPYTALLRHLDANFAGNIIKDALRYADEGQFLEAILYLNASAKLDPFSPEPFYFIGRCYMDLSQTTPSDSGKITYEKMGRVFFEKSLEIDPAFYQAALHLGFCYYNEERYLEAQEQWVAALRGNLTEDERDEAVRGLSRVKDRAVFESGRERILSGRAEEGIELLKSLEAEHDDWWNLLFFIGVGLRMQGLYEDALGYFLKVLTLNAGHVQTMNELGICLISLGDYDGALKYYKEALRLAPKNPELLCNLGIVYLNKGDNDNARTYFGKAQALAPDDEVVQMWIDHMNAGLA